MANVFNSRQTGPISAVALAPVNDSYYQDFTLEPPMVRIRAQNQAALYCSSSDSVIKNIVPNNVVVGTPGDGILMRKVKRLSLRFIKFQNSTNVINRSNNFLQVFNYADNRVYDVTIPMGYWNTPQKLITALRNGLLLSGIPVNFSFIFRGTTGVTEPVPTLDNQVTIVADQPVLFLPQCNAMRYGGSTFGFPVINVPEWNGINPVTNPSDPLQPQILTLYRNAAWTAMIIGSMPCVYTRYVDIFSPSLTKWTKLPSNSTKSAGTTFLYRLFFETFQGYPTDPGTVSVNPPTAIVYDPAKLLVLHHVFDPTFFTLNVEENISTIAIEFRDEYGNFFVGNEPYIVRETTPGNPATIEAVIPPSVFNGGVSWDLGFTAEI